MKRLLSQNNLVWSILALAGVLAFNFFFTQGFFHIWHADGKLYGSMIDVAKNGTPVLLLALGMTLVIATGGVDLSVGAIMAISGAIMAVLISRPADSSLWFIDIHNSAALALIIAIAIAVLAGTFNGLLVSLLGIQPIIATLILMVTGRGIAQLIARIENVSFTNPALVFIANGFVFHLPFPITLAAIMLVLTYLLTRATGLGLLIESVGDNPIASEYCGANTKLIKTFVYGFSGFCSGLAGVVAASDIKAATATTVGLYLELDAILAVVLGGTALIGGRFSLVGSVLGAILIQMLTTTILMHGISPSFTLMLKAMVIVVVCLLQAPALRQMFASAEGDRVKLRMSREYLPLLATVVVAVALYCIVGWRYPQMFTPGLTASLLTDNAFLGIAAVGMTFVILSGGIDLSVGSIIGCASIVIAMLIKQQLSPALAVAIVLIGGIAAGAAMGCLIYFFNLPAFLVTLAGLFFFRGLALRISTDSIGIPLKVLSPIKNLAIPLGEAVLSAEAMIFLAIVILATFITRFTRWGRNVYAIGGNEQSARLMGLPVGATKISTYALSGFCAALAGCVYTLGLSSGNATAAVGLELDAIAAVVVGGTLLSGGIGGVVGTLIGVLIFGIIQTAIVLDGTLSSPWARIAVGLLLMIFVLLQRLLTRRAA